MSIEFELVRTRRRTLELRVYPDRRVEVRAPLRASRGEIDAFVASRQDWLQTRLSRFAAHPPVSDAERYAHGSLHPFLGRQLRLVLTGSGRSPVLADDQLLLSTVGDCEAVKKALNLWYRRRAQEDFARRLEVLFPFFAGLGHGFPQLRIRAMRSRWGSMSARTGMTLSLDLIKTPPECIDYVVLHELCHLEHMNHGPGFKTLMTRLMPDWPERRKRLNRFPLR